MLNRHEITKEQALNAVRNGEFENSIIGSAEKVAVIMSQDWCPYWADMRSWLYPMDIKENIDVYELIYNTTDFFQEFKNFKETKWGNHQIPYVRYYIDGKLVKETNYVNKNNFLSILGA